MEGERKHRRDRRHAKADIRDHRSITLGQLAAAVAYQYRLTPEEIAGFSGPQLLLWNGQARIDRGEEKLLDLQLVVAPHTERADEFVRKLQRSLEEMTERR
jgi:hypothetical protein